MTVQLTVATFPLVCGRPSGTLVVALPAALAAPRAIAPRAVVVNGHRSSKVTVAAHTVSIVPARSSGVSCMSIVEGPLKIGFARTAGLRSSTAPGRYAVTLRRGTESYRATLDIAG